MVEPKALNNGDFKSFQQVINNIKSLKTEAKASWALPSSQTCAATFAMITKTANWW